MSEENAIVEDVSDATEESTFEEGGEIEASSEDSSESIEDTKEAIIEEAVKNGASKEEIKNLKKVFDLKVNGKSYKKEIDLGDEEAVRRELQLALAGRHTLQEKNEMDKMLRQQLNDWKGNPWQFFQDMGLDPDEYVTNRVQEQLAELEKSPEQKERDRVQKEIEKERAKYNAKDEELKRLRQEQEEEKRSRAFEKATAELDNEITKALDAHSSLPATPRVLKQIADTMLWAHDNAEDLGLDPDDISVEDVLPTVEKEIRREFEALLEALGDDGLEAFLGQRTLERLRKKRMAASKKLPSVSSIKAGETAKVAHKEESKKAPGMTIDDFMRIK